MYHSSRHLGLDYGSKRIGIALSDPLNIIASSFGVIPNSERSVEQIMNYVSEFEVSVIVVGMPLNLKGQKGQKAREVEEFISRLRAQTSAEIVEWDERFTSTRVHQTLRQLGVKKKKRQSKEAIDEMAAALILQSYLDSSKHRLTLAQKESPDELR